MTKKYFLLACSTLIAFLLSSAISNTNSTAYELTFYYNPDNGNVSLDTANTRSGQALSYGLRIFPDQSSIRFIPDNHLSITGSIFTFSNEETIQEISLDPFEGYFTLGDVLPTGLSASTWENLFTYPIGSSTYSPGFGFPYDDPISFVYGQPDREFDNRWDLVDPDTLTWATAASLIYRQASGEVFLDTRGTNGGHISGFYLRSEANFHDENFTPPWESPSLLVNESGIDLLGNAIEPGLFSLGNILDQGLTETEYESLITTARFFGRAGFTGDLDLETEGQSFALVYVPIPEPTTATLFTLATFLLTTSRKRTSRHNYASA